MSHNLWYNYRGQVTQIQNIVSGGLHEFIFGFQASLNQVGNAIFDTYFASNQFIALNSSGRVGE